MSTGIYRRAAVMGGVTSYIHVLIYTDVLLEWEGGGSPPIYRYGTGIYRRAAGMRERGHLLFTCNGTYRGATVMGRGRRGHLLYTLSWFGTSESFNKNLPPQV